ncbi:MAG: septal ring lytic transglycosylase RlpA family protein [Candidatus Omnitrophota bacterium]|nr:septal ring lytic transglycosylase RlpA family protein [Candidatus Omnitrophota bacterium]
MKKAAVILIILMAVVFSLNNAKGVATSSATIIKGKASWYSQNDPGILLTTANMERFDDSQFTCAIWDLPFNTILKVTNLENGKSVIVRVNDRGPAKRLNRAIDLTKTAFSQICDPEKGLADVSVETM